MSTRIRVPSIVNFNALGNISIATMALAILMVFAQNAISQEMISRTGTFIGLTDHVTSGTAEVVKTDAGYMIKLGADFAFDGAPDPKVALGKDGKYDPATLIEPLKSNTGEQSYAVPDSIDVSAYNEVYIWCEKFSVGLGVASIQ